MKLGKFFSCCREVTPFNKCFSKKDDDEENNSVARKIFWSFSIFILLICFSVHFYFQIARYLDYEKVTDALVVDNGFEFPDVTICPTQPYDSNKFETLNIENTYKTFFDAWKEIIGKDSSFKQNEDIWEATKHSVGMLLPSQRPDLFRTLQSQLVYCQYNGYLCDHTNFTTYPVPGRKNCFLLRTNQRKLKQAGEYEGLYLIFNTKNSTAFLTSTEKLSHYVGYTVDLHPKETRPQFSTASFLATVHKQTNVEVSMTTISDISTPNDRCQTDKRTINVVYDFVTTQSKRSNTFTQVLGDCREDELQLQLDINCNCLDETLIISDTTKKSLCHKIPEKFWSSMTFDVSQLSSSEKRAMKKKANCFIEERDRFRNFFLDRARCYNPCDKVIYSKTVTVNKLPESAVINDALKEINKEKGTSTIVTPNIPKLNEGLVSIKIFPPTLNAMKYKKKLEFDWVELVSEGGGIIGLWVGWCILTLFEMIEACFAVKVCPKKKNENNNDEREMQRMVA